MKYKKLSIKLTEQQFLLLNIYQVHLLEEYGQNKTKQQIMLELLAPILQATDEAYTAGGSK